MDRDRLVVLVKEAIEKDAVLMEGALGFLRGRTAKREGARLLPTAATNAATAVGGSALAGALGFQALEMTRNKLHTKFPELMKNLLSEKLDPRTATVILGALAGGAGLAALLGTVVGHSVNTGPTVPPQYQKGYEGFAHGYSDN